MTRRAVAAALIVAGRRDLARLVCQPRHVVISVVVSPDNYVYTSSGRYAWSPKRVKEAWNKAYAKLKQVLRNPQYNRLVLMVGIPASGKSTWLKRNHQNDAIYFDATFTSTRARAPVIEMGRKAGVRIEAVIMNTPIDVCLERNQCRSEDRKVPNEVIERMAATLIGDLPRKSEGIDDISVVTSA